MTILPGGDLFPDNNASYKFNAVSNLSGVYLDGGANGFPYDWTQPLTFSIWFCFANGYTGDGSTFACQTAHPLTTDIGFDLLLNDINTQRVVFGWFNTYNTNALEVYTAGGVFPIDGTTWTHLVLTLDGSGTANGLHIYINGVDMPFTTLYNSLTATGHDATNRFKIGDSHLTSFFKGNYNQGAIFLNNLSPGKIQQLYNNGTPTNLTNFDSSLLHWWYLGCGGDTTSTSIDHGPGGLNMTAVTTGGVGLTISSGFVP